MCTSVGSSQRIIGRRLNRSQGKWPSRLTGVAVSIVRCEVCDLIYANPQPVPLSIGDHYDVDPREYWHADYFSTDDGYFSRQMSRYSELAGGTSRKTALDIGAGLGKCVTALERAGFEAFGIEGSKTFFEAAARRSGVQTARLAHATIETAEFDESSFDFVTFGAVLEHLYDPSSCIARALSWTKPGGLIHLEVPSSRWLISRMGNVFYKMTGSDFVTNLSPMHPPYHLYEFGLRSFEAHAQRSGYEIAHHEFYVAAQTYLPRALDPIARYVMERTNSGMQLEVWIRKRGEKER